MKMTQCLVQCSFVSPASSTLTKNRSHPFVYLEWCLCQDIKEDMKYVVSDLPDIYPNLLLRVIAKRGMYESWSFIYTTSYIEKNLDLFRTTADNRLQILPPSYPLDHTTINYIPYHPFSQANLQVFCTVISAPDVRTSSRAEYNNSSLRDAR